MKTGKENWPSRADVIKKASIPGNAEIVNIEFDNLTINDVGKPDTNGKPFGDLQVETKEDNQGKYALVSFTPAPDADKWVAVRVNIPWTVFPNGAEWVELEIWNDNTPVNIVADGVEKNVPCFEVTFVEGKEEWKGWQIKRMGLREGQFSMWKEDTVRKIHNPFLIKYLLIMTQQGKPWKIGLRRMTFRLDKDVK